MHSKLLYKNRNRRAFTLFEMVVAIAFLAFATAMVLKMHRTSLDYDRLANQRLRTQLDLENLSQQLAAVAYADVSKTVSELARQSGAEIIVKPFETSDRDGLHFRMVIDGQFGPQECHLWRLEPRG